MNALKQKEFTIMIYEANSQCTKCVDTMVFTTDASTARRIAHSVHQENILSPLFLSYRDDDKDMIETLLKRNIDLTEVVDELVEASYADAVDIMRQIEHNYAEIIRESVKA